MNIFFLDFDPKKCAEYHCDKHVVKMIVEYAQLLSTAHHICDWKTPDKIHPDLYKPTHCNHPSALWARECDHNYRWLSELFINLSDEYTFRYDKEHSTYYKLSKIVDKTPSSILRSSGMTPLAQCMPEEYTIVNDPIEAYRNYYRGSKRDFAVWTRRDKPEWF